MCWQLFLALRPVASTWWTQPKVRLKATKMPAGREFASIRLEDAEVGVRRVLIKCCLTTPIPISWIDLGEDPHQKNFPWVKLSSWAQHLLDTGLLPRVLVGVNDFATMIFFD